MKTRRRRTGTAIAAGCACAVTALGFAGGAFAGFLPGERVLLDAHNCYPYHGIWADRVDRALSTGTPLGIEMDLMLYEDKASGGSRVVVAHDDPLNGNEPTLHECFFERVRPIAEKALAGGASTDWPLITLNLNDLRGGGDALAQGLWDLLGEYESWLCTAVKNEREQDVSSIDVKPILILTAGGKREERVFYEAVPVGGKLRLFGSARVHTRSAERKTDPVTFEEKIADELDEPATNFRRWWNHAWTSVEPEGQPRAGEWTVEDAARLKTIVDHAHKMGYWVRFYTLNGHPAISSANGWSPGYNFGSIDQAALRWEAAAKAGVDFIASDQYEDAAKAIKASRP